MKFLMSMALVLASGAAFATPAVGDTSLFKVTIAQNGAEMLGSYEISLTSKDAAGNFVMRTTVNMEDQQPVVQEQTVEGESMINDAQISQILAKCEDFGGKAGSITATTASVPTTLTTCVVPTQEGELQIAQVPFGVAKQTSADASTGQTLTLELQSFTAGK